MHRTLLLTVASVVLGIAALACNGQVEGDEGSGSTSSKSQKGAGEETQTPPSGGANEAPSTNAVVTTDPACAYGYNSSSGGSSGSTMGGAPQHFMCESVHHYTCGAAEPEITVKCESYGGQWKEGTFSCRGQSYPFDCTTGCSLTAAEYATCDLPQPDESSSGGTSGSSGWGGGSSSSSSGG